MSATQPTTKQLPNFLRPYFWEVDFMAIQLPKHETYVIERVLEYGNDQAIGWLKKIFTPDTIAHVVRRSGCLSRNTANFWALILDIPKEEIRCFSNPFHLMHSSF